MYESKHDLSWNQASLDLETLVKAAEVGAGSAYRALQREMAKYENEFRNHDILTEEGMDRYVAHKYYDSRYILRCAEELTIAAENYHFLYACLKRENITIVRPEKEVDLDDDENE